MSRLTQIAFSDESDQVKEKVVTYWSKRSDSFSEHKHEEFHSAKKVLWEQEFSRHFSKEDKLNVLDVGCGAGFFEMVLSGFCCKVTGIDLTPEMITHAKELLKRHGVTGELFVMDAEKPDFPDNSFDVIVSRNLTWTLPHPIEAYKEWNRVLKPGGMLLIYDAEYAKGFHYCDQKENLAHGEVAKAMIEACHDIYHMLSISALDRPEWDMQVLTQLGYDHIQTDQDVGDRIYHEKDQFYMPERMFLIKAKKKEYSSHPHSHM